MVGLPALMETAVQLHMSPSAAVARETLRIASFLPIFYVANSDTNICIS